MISTLLKEKMTERGISAHALEKKAGLKQSAVHNILYRRSKNPSITTLQAIAQALDCRLSELIGENSSISPEIPASTEDIPWNSTVYLQCFKTVNQILNEVSSSLSKEVVLEYVDEVYRYSMGRNSGEVDEYFARWLIARSIK